MECPTRLWGLIQRPLMSMEKKSPIDSSELWLRSEMWIYGASGLAFIKLQVVHM